MDKELRNLLVEVARGVLRALTPDEADTPKPSKRREGVVAAVNRELSQALAKPAAQPAPKRESVQATPAPAPTPQAAPAVVRGSTVRVWNGSMYVVGVVDAITRREPRRLKVRVKRAGTRDKLYDVDPAKAEVLA